MDTDQYDAINEIFLPEWVAISRLDWPKQKKTMFLELSGYLRASIFAHSQHPSGKFPSSTFHTSHLELQNKDEDARSDVDFVLQELAIHVGDGKSNAVSVNLVIAARAVVTPISAIIPSTINIAGGLYVDPISPYGSKVHLGFESLPNLLSTYQGLNLWEPQLDRGLPSSFSSPNPQTVFELLCLQDSSTSFPFTNLWGPEDGPERVYSALPEDEAIWWRFEAILSHFLDARAKSPADALSNPPPNCTPSWFALLFSILACGVQLASSEADSDMMKSRVFGKAFEYTS
ncbi:hypothetical protein ZTR_05663 [Talaromyces verruculosus]|nr:hypothetical protein ZTR_05663 [Talaromyces verruculosus]